MPDLCLIANIVAVHGVAGGLKLRSQSDIPGRFSRLDSVLIGTDPEHVQPARVARSSENGDRVLMFLEDCTDRDSAQGYVGMNMYIAEEQMEAPPEGRYFVHDLVGCTVQSTAGERLGTVKDVLLLPANDVYVVQFGTQEVLVPAVPEFITSVDIETKNVVVEPVPGLFEVEDED